MEAIDLDMSREEAGESPAESAAEPSSEGPQYPNFYVDGKEKLPIPDQGTMTIKYKRVAESESTRDGEDPHYSCTIEVQKILDCQGEADDGNAEVDPDAKLTMESILGAGE